jgi:MFS family permease
MKLNPTFITLWAGQALSALGSSMLSFALGVWVYQRTGSVTQFGLVVFCAMLPPVVLSPFAGVLVDRWRRKRVMVACDAGAGLCGLALFVLLARHGLQMPHVYVLTLVGSTFATFHQPAYGASLSLLLPDGAARGRANGMVQLGVAGAFVIGPLLAGVLLAAIGLRGILLVDCASFTLAAGSLAWLRFPELDGRASGQRQHFMHEMREGLAHIRGTQGLGWLLLLVASCNFSIGFVQVLFTPMVLAVSTQTVLGVLVSAGGAGMVVGGLATSAWGVPSQPMRGVWVGLALGGLCMALGGLRASVWLWGGAVFCYFVCIPLINASLQSIWQARVPAALQGRVFAVRNTVAFGSLPLAYLVSPLLATHFFEPWMAVHGALAPVIGSWFGTGRGRGMALMFVLVGLVLMALAAVVAGSRRLAAAGRTHASGADGLPASAAEEAA